MPKVSTKSSARKTKNSPSDGYSAFFQIRNAAGLHARAAAAFVKMAKEFSADIEIQNGKTAANGKSILGLLMLAAGKGDKIRISTKGLQAKEALVELGKLVEAGFNE